MRRELLIVALLAFASPAFGQSGSQIRATPSVGFPPPFDAQKNEPENATRCARLKDDLKERCLAEARQSTLERKPVGPESIGGSAAGAGAGASSGTSGAAGSGGSAPR